MTESIVRMTGSVACGLAVMFGNYPLAAGFAVLALQLTPLSPDLKQASVWQAPWWLWIAATIGCFCVVQFLAWHEEYKKGKALEKSHEKAIEGMRRDFAALTAKAPSPAMKAPIRQTNVSGSNIATAGDHSPVTVHNKPPARVITDQQFTELVSKIASLAGHAVGLNTCNADAGIELGRVIADIMLQFASDAVEYAGRNTSPPTWEIVARLRAQISGPREPGGEG